MTDDRERLAAACATWRGMVLDRRLQTLRQANEARAALQRQLSAA